MGPRRIFVSFLVYLLPLSVASPIFAATSVVLPFANRAATVDPVQSSLDWIGESIAETVRDAVGGRGGVTLARNEVDEAFRQLNLRSLGILTQASVLKLGEVLDAEQVVYGTFDFTPDPTNAAGVVRGSLKIAARIFDRRKFTQSSEFSESGNLEDLPTLEAHLAWRTLSLIAPDLAPPESQFRSLRPSVRLDAEENYIRGLLSREPEQRERLLLQSARLDPKFGHPAFALGRLNYDRKEYRQAAQWLQKVAPDDVHAHDASFLLGLALFQSGDFEGAQSTFQSLATAVPLSEVLNNLGAAQSRRHLPTAVDSFKQALVGDAQDSTYHFNLGYALWRKGDYAAAADRFRSVLEREQDNQFATLLLGLCLKKQGPRPGDAQLESLERLKSNYEERAYRQLKALVEPSKASP